MIHTRRVHSSDSRTEEALFLVIIIYISQSDLFEWLNQTRVHVMNELTRSVGRQQSVDDLLEAFADGVCEFRAHNMADPLGSRRVCVR